jgi:TrmH family RNA methyltransferase
VELAVIELSSTSNPLLRTVRLVAAQSRRAPADLVLAEGLRVLEEASASGHPVTAVILSGEFGTTPRQQALVTGWSMAGTRVYRVRGKVLRSISSVLEPQGAIALVRLPAATLSDVRHKSVTGLLCACSIQDPGNLGTLIRTAAAAGCSLVCTTPGTASPRNPKAIRASAGAFFRLPVVEGVPPTEILGFCRAKGLQPYRTDSRSGVDCFRVDLRSPFALLLGNEARGIGPGEWSDLPSLRIHMAGGVESLNVAAAGAVILFEALRQRSGVSTR